MTLETITAAWQEASDALKDSDRRFRELVEYSLGLICTHDLEGNLLSINPAAANSLGYKPEDGVGHNLRGFISADTRHLFDDYLRRIQEHGQDTGLMRIVSRTGTERVWMYRNVLSQGRDGRYVLGHAIDVTKRVAAESALRQREQALRLAHSELEARVAERTAALAESNERLRLEIAEREEAERLREQALIQQRDTLAFLANFSDSLARLVTFDDLIDVLRTLPVPFLADWTMVHVVDDDGSVRVIPGVHADPERQPLLAAVGVPSVSSDVLSHLSHVIGTGRFAIFPTANGEIAATAMASVTPDPLAAIGTGTAAMLPLIADGRVKGVLSLCSTRENRFTSADALILADVERRIGLALDRIQLYREAQDANRLKDEFLGTLSHELRTPLNAIFGWARILRTRDLDARTAHAVEVIERNAEAQTRLIEEVLDVSRIIRGKMTLAPESIDMAALVRATIDAVRPAMHAKRIRLEERIDDTPPVVGDSNRLQQVVLNVLSNALKFTSSEGEVTVSLRRRGTFVELEIADNGVGIRREMLPFVFDRFRQADSSTTRRFGGLGLGLAIVKHIIELHGGKVRAKSAGEGHGATFTIQLPVAERTDAVKPAVGVQPIEPSLQTALFGRTVLVVEDHDDARELIIGVLEAAGARVIAASTTREALDLATVERTDLLVADLGLPGDDGYVLLSRIRQKYPDMPAVALTAYARATDRERAIAAGFQQHVVKPVDPQQLLGTIAALL